MFKNNKWLWICVHILIATLIGANTHSALAQSKHNATQHKSVLHISASETTPVSRNVTIGLNKSMVVELPRDVRDVLVSSPSMLDAVVHTSRRAYLIGMKIGQANAFFFDKNGEQILSLEVSIERDLTGLNNMLKRFIPRGRIKAEMINDNIVLTGSAPNPSDSTRATDLASRFVKEKKQVLNMLAVTAKEQVMLKVTVAEMQRDAIKRLGVDVKQALFTAGNFSFQKIIENTFPITSQAAAESVFSGSTLLAPAAAGATAAATYTNGNQTLTGALEALERTGLIRTLAEPNLTAISGETASFLAGGEFPIPVALDDGKISVEWKPFGVGLSFTPVVMTEGRISLKISTEVSELTSEGAITLGTLNLPALKVRRANTTIELPSGGGIAIAGLISDETRQNVEGVPGLRKLPVLGNLFRSRDFRKRETELVVIVTPYVVNPVARQKLARPDGGFAPASDAKANFLGQLNRVYGRRRTVMPVGSYKGNYGFIVE